MKKAADPILVFRGDSITTSGLVHRVQEPGTHPPHRTVVMLHGRSGNEDVMWIFAQTLPQNWLLVAPRGIKKDPENGYAWHPRDRNEWPTLAQFDEAVSAVHKFIHALPTLYNADLSQIYLMGFSQGAAIAYATAMRHPGLIKGIAGLVGFVPGECEEVLKGSPLRGLPIFMAVGKKDPRIPFSRTATCAQILQKAETQLDYHEYDTGHKLNAQGMRDLKQWWQAQDQFGTK